MTPKARFYAAARGEPVDRVPVSASNRYALPKFLGYTIGEVYANVEKVCEIEAYGHEVLGFDTAGGRMGNEVDAEALGIHLHLAPNESPAVVEPYIVQQPSDLDRLAVPRPEDHRHMMAERNLIRALRGRLGPEVPLLGYVQGTFRLSAQLRGTTNFMIDLATDTGFVRALTAFAAEVSLARACWQLDAGVDVIMVSDPTASGDLISPAQFEEFALPGQQRIISGLRAHRDVPVYLHVCGDTTRSLEFMAASGADILSLDSKVDLGEARRVLGEGVALMGNVAPSQIMLQGTPEDVRREALACLEAAGPRGFILAPGCTMPRDTPAENMRALVDAAREYAEGGGR